VLQVEHERREAYKVKLENDIVLARVHEEKSQLALEEANQAHQRAKDEFEDHKKWFMMEIDRLRKDMKVVDQVV